MKLFHRIKELPFLLLGSLIFNLPALINGFPLVTSDTGTYISSGFGPVIPFDRPVIYGLFVHLTSMKESLWYVLIAQGMIAAWLLGQAIIQFLPKYSSRIYRTILFVILSFVSTLPWFCSQIMADFFSALPAICIALLLFAPKLSKLETVIISIILIFSCLTHNSHLLVNTLLIISLLLIGVIKKYFSTKIIPIGRFIKVAALVLICWPMAFIINYLIDGKFRLAGSPHVFLVARFAESGILKDYLRSNCSSCGEPELNDTTSYFLMAKHSKKFLDVEGVKTEDYARLHQWSYVNGENQKFHLSKIENGYYKIIALHSGKAISLQQDSASDNLSVVQAKDSGAVGQKFRLVEMAEKYYMIESVFSHQVLDVAEFSTVDGAKIQLFDKNNTDNQLFRFIPESSNSLCFFKDQIPVTAVDFIWSDRSILFQTGGWEKTERDYNEVIHNIVFGSKYFLWNLRESLVSTVRQLVTCDVGDGIFPYGEKSPPGFNIKWHFRKDANAYILSNQNQFGIDFSEINKRILFIMVLCSVILVLFFGNRENLQTKRELWMLSLICIYSLVLNAFVNGTMANVMDRLQSRIIWLIPFCVLLILFPALVNLFNRIKGDKN